MRVPTVLPGLAKGTATLSKEIPKMTHTVHTDHSHIHSENCGHTRIKHDGHVDYLHNGHLHSAHEGHYDEHTLPISAANPGQCAPIECLCGHEECGHELVPHGDHQDYLVNGRLHHKHGDHCDDHGPVELVA
jgi:hypothetical protein